MSHGRIHAWHAHLRRQPEPFLLAMLPLVLLALNPAWIYSRLYNDSWLYFGHMQNFAGHSRAFGDLYPASRLTILFPGVLVYQLFPAMLANQVLHLGLYYLALGSLYYLVTHTVGRRAGFVCCLICGCHFFFLEAVGWDYSDGFIVAYFLAALACLARGIRAPSWRGWLGLAGVMACAMTVANITAVVLLGLLVAFFVAWNRKGRRVPLIGAAVHFAGGGLGLLILLGFVNWLINGRFWFLASQFEFARKATPNTTNIFHADLQTWIGGAYWLVFPALAMIGAVGRLKQLLWNRDRLERGNWLAHRRSRIAILWHSQLWLVVAALLLLQLGTQYAFLQLWFYVSFLVMPLAFLSLSETWSAWLPRFDLLSYRRFCVAVSAAFIASAVVPWFGNAPGTWGVPAKIVALGLVGLIGILPFVARPQLKFGMAAAVALAGLNGICRHEFLAKTGFPPQLPNFSLLSACEALDAERPKTFRAIYECTQIARKLDRQSNVWFWFDLNEPLGPVFNSASCTQWHSRRYINREFPAILRPIQSRNPAFQPGRKIMVLSADPQAPNKALDSLHAQGVIAKASEQHAVGEAPIAFTVSVIEILSRAQAERSHDANRVRRQ
ncbi:MAG: hypothetical protein FD138_443 [Planctomycetota bacterium]|nr:MAG: hypothetical protein FD138_443 [Planctomycetota bacterium]